MVRQVLGRRLSRDVKWKDRTRKLIFSVMVIDCATELVGYMLVGKDPRPQEFDSRAPGLEDGATTNNLGAVGGASGV
jgi:hypothetical protein